MPFPFGQFTGATGDNYSTPPTPHDAYPQWDTIEHEQQQQQQQQPEGGQQAGTHPQEHPISQPDLHSPIPGSFPQTIQLEPPPIVVPSQAHEDMPVLLHPVHQQQDSRSEILVLNEC
jgi:hypothetical protein